MLLSAFSKYFWDVDIKSVDPSQNPLFVIQRLLDKGDLKSAAWVVKNFDQDTIKKTFTTMRDYSPKVAHFWKLFLNISESKILCLQKPYLRGRKSHWPY